MIKQGYGIKNIFNKEKNKDMLLNLAKSGKGYQEQLKREAKTFEQFEEENNKEIREEIFDKGTNDGYYLINELMKTEYMKIYIGCKIKRSQKNENSEEQINIESKSGTFHIIKINKKYIEYVIFREQEIDKKLMKQVYDDLRQKVETYKNIEDEYIQKLYGFVENDNFIYFIVERLSYTLNDYITETKNKNFWKKLEEKFRKIMMSILKTLSKYHGKKYHLLGLADMSNIFVKISDKYPTVIFPNPILSDLISLLKIYGPSIYKYNIFAPEIYKYFYENNKNIKELIKKKKTFDVLYDLLDDYYKKNDNKVNVEDDIEEEDNDNNEDNNNDSVDNNNSLNDRKYDYWSMGVIFFRMIQNKEPYNLEDLIKYNEVCKKNGHDKYRIEGFKTFEGKNKFSKQLMELIKGLLFYNSESDLNKRYSPKNQKNFFKKFISDCENVTRIKKDIKEDTELQKGENWVLWDFSKLYKDTKNKYKTKATESNMALNNFFNEGASQENENEENEENEDEENEDEEYENEENENVENEDNDNDKEEPDI